ncbi:hypothetical protein B0H14DRAFT_3608481 [Mycena olivaceomarginata]|nr:hypothetical protein B0H14DRAFT_3608481 [Mycena olivaceomarginata]
MDFSFKADDIEKKEDSLVSLPQLQSDEERLAMNVEQSNNSAASRSRRKIQHRNSDVLHPVHFTFESSHLYPSQIPGNLVLRRFGAKNYLTRCQLGMSFVPTWGYLTLCRVLLGMFEASFFPGIFYVISSWYTRYEVQKRLSRVSVTLFLAVIAFFLLPDFPESNTFLTPDQTALCWSGIECDRGDSVPDQLTLHKVFHHLSDWTLWAYGKCTCEYSLNIAAETRPLQGLCHVLYPASVSSISLPAFDSAILTPRFKICLGIFYIDYSQGHGVELRRRAASRFIVIQALISITGLCLTAFRRENVFRYFGIFLLNAGELWVHPKHFSYISFGGVGGIIASTVYREKDFPRYLPGLWVTLGAQFLLLFLVWATTLHFTRLNRLSRAGKLAGPLEGQKLELESASAAIAIIQSHAVEPWSPVDRCTSVAANEGSVGVLPAATAALGAHTKTTASGVMGATGARGG